MPKGNIPQFVKDKMKTGRENAIRREARAEYLEETVAQLILRIEHAQQRIDKLEAEITEIKQTIRQQFKEG